MTRNGRRRPMRRAMGLTAIAAIVIVGGALAGCAAEERGLPEGLPDTIQVVDGAVSNAVTGSGESWSFTVKVPDAAAQKSAVATLTNDGFSEIGRGTSDAATTVALKNAKTGINATLLLTMRDEEYLVIYNLVKAG